MLLMTTKTTSRTLPDSYRFRGDEEDAYIADGGVIVRECATDTAKEAMLRIWVTKSTAEFYTSNTDEPFHFKRITHEEAKKFTKKRSIMHLVASAWIAPHEDLFASGKRPVPINVDEDKYEFDAENIAMIPKIGNSKQLKVSLIPTPGPAALPPPVPRSVIISSTSSTVKQKKEDVILKHVLKHGLDNINLLRRDLQSNATDDTILSYISDAIIYKRYDDDIWKNATSSSIRIAVGECVDDVNNCRLKDLYDYVNEFHDLAVLGKSASRVYCELRIVLHFLRHFEEKGIDYPEGWF